MANGSGELPNLAAGVDDESGADGNASTEEIAVVDDIPDMEVAEAAEDAVRAAHEDDHSDDEQDEATSDATPELGESGEKVEAIHQLITKEKTLMVGRPNVPLPTNFQGSSSSDFKTSLLSQSESSSASVLQEAVPVVLISDPGQDLDDEMMFIMSSHLHSLGLISLRGVIANLHPSFARARLARGTFDLLGLHNVPVGIGTDGGDTAGMHSSEQFESTASSYIIKEDDEAAVSEFESGHRLLQRLYEAAPDIEHVETTSGGEEEETTTNGEETSSKKCITRGGLTIVITSSLKDMSNFVSGNPNLFASKTREVVIMGGCQPVSSSDEECLPDSAQNNTFDPQASAHFYSQCQRMNVTLTVVARHSAYAAKMPRSVYDDLALTGSAIGRRLRDSQRAGIDQLWRRAVSEEKGVRKGLPPRCDRRWFVNTFCGGNDDPRRSGEDSIWDLVTGFMQYDTLALLASIPAVREAYFSPAVLPPLRSESVGEGEERNENGAAVHAFGTGTRNLIGISEEEHNLKEPSLLVQLLKTGYRQGLLCNQAVECGPPSRKKSSLAYAA